MVSHQDRLLNRALPPTGFPFVASLLAAPIGWSSITSVSLLLGARFGMGFPVRVSKPRHPAPHAPRPVEQPDRSVCSLTVRGTFEPSLHLLAPAAKSRQVVLLELLGGRPNHGFEQVVYATDGPVDGRPEREVVVRPLLLLFLPS